MSTKPDRALALRLSADAASADAILLELVRQALEAMEYIHARQIVHLDIKPANLFVDGNNLLVLADFGFRETPRRPRPNFWRGRNKTIHAPRLLRSNDNGGRRR